MKNAFLVGVLICRANAHPNHENGKIEKAEKTYHVELPDRVVTVQRLNGPPLNEAGKRDGRSTPRGVNAQSNIPTETFFVHSVVCADGRTYLEWWSLSQSPKVVHQAWSGLDWSDSDGLSSFQHERIKYAVMYFSTVSSKEELAKLGKPNDPNASGQMTRSPSKKEPFTRGDQNDISTSSFRFINACHRYLESQKKLGRSKGRNPHGTSTRKTIPPKKKLSTLRYWRSE